MSFFLTCKYYRGFLCILITLSTISFSYKQKIVKPLDYCSMLDNDSKYVNYDKNSKNYLSDKKNRYSIFKYNYENIIELSKSNGFPDLWAIESELDTCKRAAIRVTFIHIAQSDINLFYKYEHFFKKEIEKGNMPIDLIGYGINVMLHTNELCEEEEKNLKNFLKRMDLENYQQVDKTLIELLNEKEIAKCI